MEIIGRDKNEQTGNNNRMDIVNKEAKHPFLYWLALIIVGVVVAGIVYYIGWN